MCYSDFLPDINIIRMSRLASPDWLMLPELVWEEIILMVGLSSLRDLDSCIQVCRAWNTVIRSKINPTNKWGRIIQQRLEKSFDAENSYPSDEEISHAKSLGINDKHCQTMNSLKLIVRN